MRTKIESAQPGSKGAFKTTFKTNYITKRYPAYGRKLDEIRRKNLIPALRVVVSTDWELGVAYPRIVIPADANPECLEFRYLAGLSVQIVHHDGENDLAKSLADEILKAHPKSLVIFNFDAGLRQDPEKRATTQIYPALEGLGNDL